MKTRVIELVAALVGGVLIISLIGVSLTLGNPKQSVEDQRYRLYHPTPPVSQQKAEEIADGIIVMDYPYMAGAEKSTVTYNKKGYDYTEISYRKKFENFPQVVVIAINKTTGQVSVFHST